MSAVLKASSNAQLVQLVNTARLSQNKENFIENDRLLDITHGAYLGRIMCSTGWNYSEGARLSAALLVDNEPAGICLILPIKAEGSGSGYYLTWALSERFEGRGLAASMLTAIGDTLRGEPLDAAIDAKLALHNAPVVVGDDDSFIDARDTCESAPTS